MGDLNVIDRFMAAFVQYIDSGFGLLRGDVAFLSSTLIGIDITLAGLFWAMGGENDVIGRFLKKILYVGAFALIIGSFATLADVIFKSFAGLGITAGGGKLSPDDLLRPGFIASTGFDAAKPLLEQVSQATNQLLALSTKQQLQLQEMMSAEFRSDAIERARRLQAEAEAKAATRRFLGSGKAYTPGN